jgi:hypothetical protein
MSNPSFLDSKASHANVSLTVYTIPSRALSDQFWLNSIGPPGGENCRKDSNLELKEANHLNIVNVGPGPIDSEQMEKELSSH